MKTYDHLHVSLEKAVNKQTVCLKVSNRHSRSFWGQEFAEFEDWRFSDKGLNCKLLISCLFSLYLWYHDMVWYSLGHKNSITLFDNLTEIETLHSALEIALTTTQPTKVSHY